MFLCVIANLSIQFNIPYSLVDKEKKKWRKKIIWRKRKKDREEGVKI